MRSVIGWVIFGAVLVGFVAIGASFLMGNGAASIKEHVKRALSVGYARACFRDDYAELPPIEEWAASRPEDEGGGT